MSTPPTDPAREPDRVGAGLNLRKSPAYWRVSLGLRKRDRVGSRRVVSYGSGAAGYRRRRF